MTTVDNARELAALVAGTHATIVAECTAIAARSGQDAQALARDVVSGLRSVVGRASRWDAALADRRDGRETLYTARVQLIYGGGIEADSHPELELNTPGDIAVAGLLNVPALARGMAEAFHASRNEDPPDWPDAADLERRMRSVRVALTRGGGQGRWRIPYTVSGVEWLAFVLVSREVAQVAPEAVPATTPSG